MSWQLSDPDSLLAEPRTTPPELIRWLTVINNRPCSAEAHAPFFRATSRITWGVLEQYGDRPLHERLHVWKRSRVVALLDARGTAVTIEVRHPGVNPQHPVTIRVAAEGTSETQMVLTTPEWIRLTVPLGTTWRTWTRQMHRLDLEANPEAPPGLQMRPLDVVY